MNKTVFILSFLSICLALGVTLFGLNAIKQPSVSGTWTHEHQDIKTVGLDILRHRVILSYEAEAEDLCSDDIINKIFENIEVP